MNVLIMGDVNLTKNRFDKDAAISVAESMDGAKQALQENGAFDVVFLSQVAQRFARHEVIDWLKDWREFLTDDGEIFVSAPSLEWACAEALRQDEMSMPVYMALYGRPDLPHKSGYTLWLLRAALEEAGYTVRRTAQELYTLTNARGESVYAYQNLVIAITKAEA